MSINPNVIRFEHYRFWYEKIVKEFGFDQKKDEDARDLLYSYRKNYDPTDLIEQIYRESYGKDIIFFGAGPNLSSHFDEFGKKIAKNRRNYYIVAADGATNALQMHSIDPDLVVSDLDGLSHNQFLTTLELNIIVLVHGHGDNMDLLKAYAPLILKYKNIIPTTQVEPKFPVINPGGFTDGDRGLFFLNSIVDKAVPFYLLGYEFGDSIGKFSKNSYRADQPMTDIKRKKLGFCKHLLSYLHKDLGREIIYNTV